MPEPLRPLPAAAPARVIALAIALAACDAAGPALDERARPLAGGEVTAAHPAVVGLVSDDHVVCSGVVIAPSIVLSAAHCPRPAAIAFVRDGVEETVAVEGWTVHPEHVTQSLAADLAFARTATPLPIAPLPVALGAALSECHVGRAVVMVGRGHTGPGGLGSHAARAGTGTVVALDAERVTVDGGDVSLCAGDSGGALLVDDGAGWIAIGVAALGSADCRGVSIFTRTDRWMTDMDARGLGAVAPAVPAAEVACASVEEGGCDAGGGGAGVVVAIVLAVGAIAMRRRRRGRSIALVAAGALVACASPPSSSSGTRPATSASGASAAPRKMITRRDFARPPGRAEVATDGYPAIGPADAPVTIVFAFDLRCAWSRRGAAFVDELVRTHGDRVRVVYRNAQVQERHALAARALCAAQKQDRHRALLDVLWREEDRNLPRPRLRAAAEAAGLDLARFDADLDGDACAASATADRDGLATAGATTSPTFFVNGTRILGLQTELVNETLTAELAAATAARTARTDGAHR